MLRMNKNLGGLLEITPPRIYVFMPLLGFFFHNHESTKNFDDLGCYSCATAYRCTRLHR